MNNSQALKTGDKDYDYFAKVVIVGDSAVGKTNLLLRFVNGEYVTTHITTIGIDFKVKTLKVNGKRLKIQLWDTAGQDRFRTITKTYYKGSAGIVLVQFK
jgi:small GTP-binding protein